MATQGFKHRLSGERQAQVLASLRKAGVNVSASVVEAVYMGRNSYASPRTGITQLIPAHKYRAVERELFDKLGKR